MIPSYREPRHLREAEIQRLVVAFFRKVGCEVWVFSDGRRVRKQMRGAPDLWVLPPHGKAFWWETKTPQGEQSEDQKRFQAACERCGTPYVMGGTVEAFNWWITRSERAA